MKLYRVTVRRPSTGEIVKQHVCTSINSMYSVRGYWSSRWTPRRDDQPGRRTYEVQVETAYVTDWLPFDPKIEEVERSIIKLPDSMNEAQLRELVRRINWQLDGRVEAMSNGA